MLLLCPTPLVASFLLLPGQTHKALLIMNRPLSALLNTELQADAQPFINDPVQLIRPHGARSCSQPLVPRNGIIMLMWFQLRLRYRIQVLEWAFRLGGLPRDSFSWERYVCFWGPHQPQEKASRLCWREAVTAEMRGTQSPHSLFYGDPELFIQTWLMCDPLAFYGRKCVLGTSEVRGPPFEKYWSKNQSLHIEKCLFLVNYHCKGEALSW